jgi:hypothetical protein
MIFVRVLKFEDPTLTSRFLQQPLPGGSALIQEEGPLPLHVCPVATGPLPLPVMITQLAEALIHIV